MNKRIREKFAKRQRRGMQASCGHRFIQGVATFGADGQLIDGSQRVRCAQCGASVVGTGLRMRVVLP